MLRIFLCIFAVLILVSSNLGEVSAIAPRHGEYVVSEAIVTDQRYKLLDESDWEKGQKLINQLTASGKDCYLFFKENEDHIDFIKNWDCNVIVGDEEKKVPSGIVNSVWNTIKNGFNGCFKYWFKDDRVLTKEKMLEFYTGLSSHEQYLFQRLWSVMKCKGLRKLNVTLEEKKMIDKLMPKIEENVNLWHDNFGYKLESYGKGDYVMLKEEKEFVMQVTLDKYDKKEDAEEYDEEDADSACFNFYPGAIMSQDKICFKVKFKKSTNRDEIKFDNICFEDCFGEESKDVFNLSVKKEKDNILSENDGAVLRKEDGNILSFEINTKDWKKEEISSVMVILSHKNAQMQTKQLMLSNIINEDYLEMINTDGDSQVTFNLTFYDFCIINEKTNRRTDIEFNAPNKIYLNVCDVKGDKREVFEDIHHVLGAGA